MAVHQFAFRRLDRPGRRYWSRTNSVFLPTHAYSDDLGRGTGPGRYGVEAVIGLTPVIGDAYRVTEVGSPNVARGENIWCSACW